MVAAVENRVIDDETPEIRARSVKTTAGAVEDISDRKIKQANNAIVLWVDDIPNNNIYERRSLEALGVNFVIAVSIDIAISEIKKRKFDVIISDMGRPPDSMAGYTLLDSLRKSGNNTPFVIYASSRSPEHISESRRRGALGCTNRPDELFDYVLSAIGRGE